MYDKFYCLHVELVAFQIYKLNTMIARQDKLGEIPQLEVSIVYCKFTIEVSGTQSFTLKVVDCLGKLIKSQN